MLSSSVAALVFERCLSAIAEGRPAEAELLLRDIDLSPTGPAARALHAKLWELASIAGPNPSGDKPAPPAPAPLSPPPRISLVTSVFNRFWQLRDALPRNLETIRGQSDVELVVVDFGGDDSAEIRDFIDREFAFDLMTGQLAYFVAAVPWTRFHMATAKNVAHQLSRGAFVFSLDADNFFLPEDLAVVREHALHHPEAVLHQTTGAAPMRHSSWSKYELLSDGEAYHDEPPTWNGSSGRVGTTRENFERVNGYNENFVGMGMDDIDFLIRSMKAGADYRHIRIERPANAVFIDNGSADDAHEHENNRENWARMDDALRAGRLAPIYATDSPPERFRRHVASCIQRSATARVTLFSSLFRIQSYLDRFLNDLREITATPGTCVWLLDVVGSHPETVSERLRAAADGRCVFYVPVRRDPGLYALWNVAIRSVGSPYLGNLNADDLRGAGWLPSCLRMLESGLADVASPVTVPFSDETVTSHAEALSAQRARDGRETRWFEARCIVEGSFPNEVTRYERLADGVYSQQDLFQLMADGSLASYCIPNASSVWSRRVHDLAGHFDEEKWGTFADLALWAEAGARGARFRQVPHLALFYICEQQAHRRQARNENRLVQLALRHGAPGMRDWVSRRQFDLSRLDGGCGDRQGSGWRSVCDEVGRHFRHATPRVMLDMSVERSFLGDASPGEQDLVLRRPWMGFVHSTLHANPTIAHQEEDLDALLDEPRFAASLEHCRGLIALSERNRAYLARRLAGGQHALPVYLLFHPGIPLPAPAASCTVDLGTPSRPKVFHIGWQLQSFSRFAKLRLDRSQKVLLVPQDIAVDHFLRHVVDPELRLHDLGPAEEHFAQICSASLSDYAHVLKHGVVFNHCAEPAGSRFLPEHVGAGTKLVINRHPAFAEYLGTDYPLFYDDEAEADSKLELALSAGSESALRHELEAIRERRSIGQFCRELGRIGEHVYDSL